MRGVLVLWAQRLASKKPLQGLNPKGFSQVTPPPPPTSRFQSSPNGKRGVAPFRFTSGCAKSSQLVCSLENTSQKRQTSNLQFFRSKRLPSHLGFPFTPSNEKGGEGKAPLGGKAPAKVSLVENAINGRPI